MANYTTDVQNIKLNISWQLLLLKCKQTSTSALPILLFRVVLKIVELEVNIINL
jgi:hypothetical protein